MYLYNNCEYFNKGSALASSLEENQMTEKECFKEKCYSLQFKECIYLFILFMSHANDYSLNIILNLKF